MQLIRGQKLKLSDVLNNSLSFSLATTLPSNLNLDIALFGLDSHGVCQHSCHPYLNQATETSEGLTRVDKRTGLSAVG